MVTFSCNITAANVETERKSIRKIKWNKVNISTKCRTERRFHAFKFSDGYKSTMDWCSVYLTPQALPKYIYLSPPRTEGYVIVSRIISVIFLSNSLWYSGDILIWTIAVNIVVKVFHIWHSDPYMNRLRPSRESFKRDYVLSSDWWIKIFVPWIFQLSFCICGHNLLFPTIFK
jgi:hypothetical protein